MSDAIGNRTMVDLLHEKAEADPSKAFLVFEDKQGRVREFSYGEFLDGTKRVAAGLRALGVGQGDRVVVHLKNCPEFLFSWFALASLGAVIVPSNTANTRSEIEFIAQRAEVVGVITESVFEPVVKQGFEDAVASYAFTVYARTDTAPAGCVLFESLLREEPDDLQHSSVKSDDISQILFTSGTTAKPKGVLVTHANALWSGERALKGMGYRSEDRCMTALPLFHVNGQAVTVLGAMTAGATVVLLEQFDATRYMEQVRRHEVTQTSLVATQSKALLKQPPSVLDCEHSLTTIGHAINVTDAEKSAFEKRFGVRFVNIYGLSEATEIVTFSPLHGPQRWPSVGLPAIDREVRIASADGRECPVGERGEIEVRGVPGRTVMAGYFGDPEATALAFDGEWLRTGDFGYADAAGYVYFVDRQKDLIKSSGQNVSAIEVEEVLCEHPFVVEAAVIAVAHPTRGEAVKAFVVVTVDAPTADELKEFCSAQLSRYKVPEFIEFIDALPRTSVGKIAKGELRAREAEAHSISVLVTAQEQPHGL